MPEPKAPYKMTVKLSGARPDVIAQALAQLRELASAYGQTGEASATLILESFREAPLSALGDTFETWLWEKAPGKDCEVKLQRPGVRPETKAMRAREKRETPMDEVWKGEEGDEEEPIGSDTIGARAVDWLVAREG